MALKHLIIGCGHAAINAAEKITYQRKRKDFEDNITDIAEKYIGIPYEFGKGFKKSSGSRAPRRKGK